MKRHLNTLFVTTQGAYLRKDGQAIVVRVEQKTLLRIPLHNLDGVVCFGVVGCSPALMAACAQANVTISFLSIYGGFRAAVVGFSPGNVLLRREQYRQADDPECSLRISCSFVTGKVANARSVMLRAARDSKNPAHVEQLQKAAKRMAFDLEQVRNATSLDQLRGIEGESANRYFETMNAMQAEGVNGFEFTSRSRRPPLDRINALLSFLYAMLAHDVRSACEATGLDAAVGFLHRDRPGRPGLALDLMEEFRPFLVDRLVLALVNRRQIQANDFEVTESGAVLLNDKPRKAVLAAWQKRKQDTITHPFLDEKTSIGLLVHLQARLLARYLRGDMDAYPPFLWK